MNISINVDDLFWILEALDYLHDYISLSDNDINLSAIDTLYSKLIEGFQDIVLNEDDLLISVTYV